MKFQLDFYYIRKKKKMMMMTTTMNNNLKWKQKERNYTQQIKWRWNKDLLYEKHLIKITQQEKTYNVRDSTHICVYIYYSVVIFETVDGL